MGSEREAAVGEMDLARRIGALVGGEIDREHGDFLRLAEPAHRLAVDEGLADDARSDWFVSLASVAMRWSSEGLSIVPGQIALQRTPRLMKSAATALVRPITAAFEAP